MSPEPSKPSEASAPACRSRSSVPPAAALGGSPGTAPSVPPSRANAAAPGRARSSGSIRRPGLRTRPRRPGSRRDGAERERNARTTRRGRGEAPAAAGPMPGPPPPGPALAPSPRERGMRRAVSAVLAACLSLRPAAGCKEISARGLRHGDVLFNRSFRQRHGACAATVVPWQTAAEEVVHSFYGAGDQLARQHGRFRGRTRFFPEGLRRGEAVLRLHDLLLDDAGNSSAWVFFQGDEEPVHGKISLWVSGQEHGSGWQWCSWMSAVSVVFLLLIVLGLCCWCFLRRSKGAARRCRDVVRSRLRGRHDAGSPLTGPPETRPAETLPAAPAPGEAAADAAGGPAAAPEPPDQADAAGGGGRGGQ